jgi:small-conductance mechanosensitive channel
MEDFLYQQFLGNRVIDYIIAGLVLIGGVFLVWLIRRLLVGRLNALAEKTTSPVDNVVVETVRKYVLPLGYAGVLYAAIRPLTLSKPLATAFTILVGAILAVTAIRFVNQILAHVFRLYWVRHKGDETRERSLQGLLVMIQIGVWGLGIVFLLDNLGFEITSVIAGLGIGGVAVALAAQAILGDLFSYFAILFDRPFEIGDFIIVGDLMGAVEGTGIKTTRIRSLSGEQLVFSNTDLTNSRVRNFKRMERRRVVFKLGVTYDTNVERLEQVPGLIKEIIESVDDTVFDRAHFAAYGDFSLIFEVVYYVLTPDYNVYMDIQQRINLALNSAFAERGIEFAYPTQTVYLAKQAAGAGD